MLAGTESIDDIVLAPPAAEVDLRLKTPATALDLDTRTVRALLAWPNARTPRTVIAVNHHTPPAKLKRLLRSTAVGSVPRSA